MTLRITTALLIWCAAMALPLPASAQATFTTLYSFCTQGAFPDCTDGLSPEAGLIQAAPAGSVFVVEADVRLDFQTLPDPQAWDVRSYPPAMVGIYRKE